MSPATRKRRGSARANDGALDPRVVKAIAHPLRHRLLLAFNERVASPNELAKLLGEPLGNVAYHTRILLDLEAIELVDTAQRRGATEHYYRASMRAYFDDTEWGRLPITSRRTIFAQDLQALFDDVSRAIAAGGFDHPRAHVSRAKLELDAEGFEDVVELLGETLDRVLEIHAEALNRIAQAGEGDDETLRTEVGILHFEQVDDPRPAAKRRRPARKARA
jgi:hypothetical protein